jgi:hypothetical protein
VAGGSPPANRQSTGIVQYAFAGYCIGNEDKEPLSASILRMFRYFAVHLFLRCTLCDFTSLQGQAQPQGWTFGHLQEMTSED